MARGGAQKEDSVQRLREELAAWVLREVAHHAETQPGPVRGDVVAAVQSALEGAIDAKIQEFGEARSARIAEDLREEVASAFDRLQDMFVSRLAQMEQSWSSEVSRHLAKAETEIQEQVLEKARPRLEKLVKEQAARLEHAFRKTAADVQRTRNFGAVATPGVGFVGGSQVQDPEGGEDLQRSWYRRPLGLQVWHGMAIVSVVVVVWVLAAVARPAQPNNVQTPADIARARESSAERLRAEKLRAEAEAEAEANTAAKAAEKARAPARNVNGQTGAASGPSSSDGAGNDDADE